MNRLWITGLAAALVAGAPFIPRTGATARAACDPSPPGLVGSWQAEGDYTDCQGLKDGTQVGSVPFAPGKIGQSFSYSTNPNNYVDLGNPASLKFTDAITICAWIYPTAAPDPSNLRAILVKWGQRFTPPVALEDAYGLWTENGSGGFLRIFGAVNLDPGGGGAIEPHADGGSVPLNAWSHVAMTFDRSQPGANLVVYVNCSAVASSIGGDHPIIQSDKRVLIGREDSPIPRPWAGLIDQVRVFARALSADEISQLARAGDPEICGHFAFSFACPPDTVVDAKGTASRIFTITNTGTVTDNYEYSVTDNSGWITPVSDTTGPVPPNGSFSVKVTATGDADCNPATDVVTFSVRSTGSLEPPQTCTTTLTCSPVQIVKTLSSDPNPSICGDKVTLTNRLSQLDATGVVTFYDGTDSLGSKPVVDGVATLSITTLTAGTYSVTAVYSGDGGHLPATSNKIQQVVNPISTTTSLASDPNPSTCGQKVTLTATVTPATAAGEVNFFDGGVQIGSGTLVNGVTTLSMPTLGLGPHSFTAVYKGNSCYSSSPSEKVVQVVTPTTTTTTLTSSSSSSMCEVKVMLTARVAPSTATGTVNFFDSTAAIGSATLVNGSATLSLDSLAHGSHSFTAVYKGDSCDAPGVSNKLEHFHDCPTATLLSMFRAEALNGVIELRWEFSDPGYFVDVHVERSVSHAGPWMPVAAEIRDAAGIAVAIDRTVEAERSYWYRLVARPESGLPWEFGPIEATAGSAIQRFELGAAWPNPSQGNAHIDFAVARESKIRLSIIDVLGREVALLAHGTHGPGRYQAVWTGQTPLGPAPIGLYFVRYQYPGKVLIGRLVLAR